MKKNGKAVTIFATRTLVIEHFSNISILNKVQTPEDTTETYSRTGIKTQHEAFLLVVRVPHR